MDKKRQAAAQKLLDAAHEFWSACHEEGQYGAVQWLTSTTGELVIFTRGEYRERLMANIQTLPSVEKIHMFGEEIPSEDDEAIGWAYGKCVALGLENGSEESAMMMDRLKMMLGGQERK